MFALDPYDALVPVYLETDIPRRIAQIGTAVFVEVHGEPFLFTAAHVTDDRERGELLVPTNHGLSPIEGYVGYVDLLPETSRSEDDVDIAYYRLSSEFARALCHHFLPLAQQRCDILLPPLEPIACSASGYPASKSRKTADGAYTSEIFSFRGVSAAPETYEKWSLSPDINIVLNFNKKSAVDPATLKSFSTPSLRGISGGGIFAWPKGQEISDDWSLPKLVGLVHSFKEKEGLIIGTTLLPILSAIQLGRMKGYGGVR